MSLSPPNKQREVLEKMGYELLGGSHNRRTEVLQHIYLYYYCQFSYYCHIICIQTAYRQTDRERTLVTSFMCIGHNRQVQKSSHKSFYTLEWRTTTKVSDGCQEGIQWTNFASINQPTGQREHWLLMCFFVCLCWKSHHRKAIHQPTHPSLLLVLYSSQFIYLYNITYIE